MAQEDQPMTREVYAKLQLQQTYNQISADDAARNIIKTWCITVLGGSFVLWNQIHGVCFEKRMGGDYVLTFAPLVITLGFCALDFAYQGYIAIHRDHAKNLEKMLVQQVELDACILLSNSVATGGEGFKPRTRRELWGLIWDRSRDNKLFKWFYPAFLAISLAVPLLFAFKLL